MKPTAVMLDDVCLATVDRSKCASYDEYVAKLSALVDLIVGADPSNRFKYHFVDLKED